MVVEIEERQKIVLLLQPFNTLEIVRASKARILTKKCMMKFSEMQKLFKDKNFMKLSQHFLLKFITYLFFFKFSQFLLET